MTDLKCSSCDAIVSFSKEELSLFEKLEIPIPEECFLCRTRHRLAFWTFGKFRKGKSDLSGESLITVLPEKPRFPIYTSKEWFSDDWEPPATDYNPDKSFFDQLKELQEKTPHPHQFGRNNFNSDWCDDVWESKNCYLCRSLLECENVGYGYRVVQIKDSFDLAYSYSSEKIYDAAYIFNSFRVKYAFNVRDSMDSIFLYDCRNVRNCFMCWNLRNKQYHIKNQPYSKEEYFEKIKDYDFGSLKTIKKLKIEWRWLLQNEAIHRENLNFRIKNSTGNFLSDCNNCINCFQLEGSENSANIVRGLRNKNCIEMSGGLDMELSGQVCQATSCFDAKFCLNITNCRYSMYLDQCNNCEYCFGCVCLRKKKFCILNKQYTEEEYEKLKEEIIKSMKSRGEYGKFLPLPMAYTGYNLSLANIYFPKTKEEVRLFGGLWDNIEKSTEGISADQLPDNIKDVDEKITSQPLICSETGYRFNISERELVFLEEMNIPLPVYHPDYRTKNRFGPLTSLTPYSGTCAFCHKEIITNYPTDWGYKKIACEACYNEKVI